MPVIADFFKRQMELEAACQTDGSCLSAFVLAAGFDTFTIASNSTLQKATAPLSRGRFLLAFSESSYAVLLRVRDKVTSPLRTTEDMAMYEIGKRSIYEIDYLTRSDLSWLCYDCDPLGCFYEYGENVYFSGDLPALDSALDYRVYSISTLEPLVVSGKYRDDLFSDGFYRASEYNSIGKPTFIEAGDYSTIGYYRPSEMHSTPTGGDVYLYEADLISRRTALFGKTRSGKSNTLKQIASMLIRYNQKHHMLGQLIIDTNGEYANDNSQDGKCLATRFPRDCIRYSLNPKPGCLLLRCNFYLSPIQAMAIFSQRLSRSTSTYITAFLSVPLPGFSEIKAMSSGSERTRSIRRIQLFWVALHCAGFPVKEADLELLPLKVKKSLSVFDPSLTTALRDAMYKPGSGSSTPHPTSLDELTAEFKALKNFYESNPDDKLLLTSSGNPLLDPDDLALLSFAFPKGVSSGPKVLASCRSLHDARADNFLKEIPKYLDRNKTVILDMSNASPALISFFTDQVCTEVFHHQEQHFTDNTLADHHVQLYIEEAHNYFPAKDDNTGIYARIAKEGAKFHIGLVYSTQSPSTISGELFSQTENFFVAHLDSSAEVDALVRRSAPFAGVKSNILRSYTPGYLHMLTASQRYPIPVQARNFSDEVI